MLLIGRAALQARIPGFHVLKGWAFNIKRKPTIYCRPERDIPHGKGCAGNIGPLTKLAVEYSHALARFLTSRFNHILMPLFRRLPNQLNKYRSQLEPKSDELPIHPAIGLGAFGQVLRA